MTRPRPMHALPLQPLGDESDPEAVLRDCGADHVYMRRALCELREAVLEQVGKDQTDRLCHALDVAVATVTSTMSPYTGPDGVKQGPQKQVRTFIVVKRG